MGRPVEARVSTDQLAAILGGIGHGVTAQGPDGELLYANDAAARLCGLESSDELLALSVAEVLDRFEIVGEDGAPLPPGRLPNQLALATGETHEGVVGYRLKPSGEERWSVLSSRPQLSETGAVELVVNVFQDVTAERSAEARIRFLAEASSILAAPLGVEETLAELAALLVPRLADYCIVDLLGEDESLRQIVIAHRNPEREALLRELRRRYHPESNPGHPVSRVIESGAPLLIPDARVGALAEAAVDEEHMRMYETLEALSYIVVPLATRGRLLGTISLGTGESRRRFGTSDLELATDIAARAALAIDNALLLEQAQRSFAQLDTLLVSAPVGIGFWDRELRFIRVNDALAAINRLSAEEHVGRTLAEVIPHLAPRLEPLYRQVLESGEPIVHTESTDDAGEQIGDKRHWLSSYYPVRAPVGGGVIGVGAVIMEITDRKRADDRLRLLAEAGELFSSSLDREEIFRRIAHVVVPRIADACNIFLADGDSLLRVARAHADPELERLMHTMPDSYAVPGVTPPLMRRVVGAGEPLLFPTVTRELVDELEQIGLDRKAFLRVGSRSMMFVPFVSRGETLGVMTLGSREPGRYGASDLDLALELARRASAAIDNARLVRELRFRTTLLESQQEASVDGLLVVSPEGRLLSHNRRFAELWGFSDELIAQDSDAAALEQAVEKVADPEAFLERVEYLYAHPDETSREEILLKDGRVLDRHCTPVRGPDGEFHGWLWSFRDVTERKVAEDALRAAQARLERRAEAARALRFVDDGVFLVDRGGIVRLWNPAATRIAGLEQADVTGRIASEVLAGWPLERVGERTQAFPYDGPSGERWLSLTAGAFPHGTVYAFRDLTDERAVEQLKSDFVSTVSHELRTPLAAIYGAAMTLRRDDVVLSPDQQEGMLGVIAGESERLAKIVNDILLASRLDSGAAQVSIGSADATELARSVLAAAETHLRSGIELSLSAPDPGPHVAADPDGLRQVLVNLVDNAVKYSPEGGLVEVEIDLSDGHVRFVVRDRGLGIPATEHERIFEKFFRLDPNLSRGVGGTGLGLYISREIVRRMGGRIEVQSEPGQGSSFSFELPLAADV